MCVLVYLVFPKHLFSIADLFAVGYLWVVGNEDKCCVVTHRAADIRVAWLVYARTYGVPIATLHQNKRTRLLYLGDAQIKRKALILHANARISEVGFLRESLGWARIKGVSVVRIDKCQWAFSSYQKRSETPMERSIE